MKSSSKRNFHCLPNTRNTFPNLFLYFGGVARFRFLYCYFIENFVMSTEEATEEDGLAKKRQKRSNFL